MTLDTRTIVLIVGRLVDLASVPALFNDRMTPHRVSKRLERVLDWLGPAGRIVASDHIRRRTVPPAGKRQWSRGDYGLADTWPRGRADPKSANARRVQA